MNKVDEKAMLYCDHKADEVLTYDEAKARSADGTIVTPIYDPMRFAKEHPKCLGLDKLPKVEQEPVESEARKFTLPKSWPIIIGVIIVVIIALVVVAYVVTGKSTPRKECGPIDDEVEVEY